jgi:hypothetical protein
MTRASQARTMAGPSPSRLTLLRRASRSEPSIRFPLGTSQVARSGMMFRFRRPSQYGVSTSVGLSRVCDVGGLVPESARGGRGADGAPTFMSRRSRSTEPARRCCSCRTRPTSSPHPCLLSPSGRSEAERDRSWFGTRIRQRVWRSSGRVGRAEPDHRREVRCSTRLRYRGSSSWTRSSRSQRIRVSSTRHRADSLKLNL